MPSKDKRNELVLPRAAKILQKGFLSIDSNIITGCKENWKVLRSWNTEGFQGRPGITRKQGMPKNFREHHAKLEDKRTRGH